jgi:alkanesulfonate monooxygenase SsuD/methylene tetrahydromethanopterin reductase-like flavin-dependent oxidoreductase (luciferase family)
MWIGGASSPSRPVLERIGRHANGWFALCAPDEYAEIRARIDAFAREAGRDPADIGAESGVGIHDRTDSEWLGLVAARRATGVTHLCMRTLGGELSASGHLEALRRIRKLLDGVS